MNDWLKENIDGASNETLHQWLANAIATTSCIGHTKGRMNEMLAEHYRDALIERGENVPEIDFWKCLDNPNSYRDKLHEIGVYNGEGSQ